jgi:hypothetical protein
MGDKTLENKTPFMCGKCCGKLFVCRVYGSFTGEVHYESPDEFELDEEYNVDEDGYLFDDPDIIDLHCDDVEEWKCCKCNSGKDIITVNDFVQSRDSYKCIYIHKNQIDMFTGNVVGKNLVRRIIE